MLPTAEQLNCLRLIMTDNIGPITYGQLISYYGSATEAIKHLSDLAHNGGSKKKLSPAPLSVAEKQFEIADKKNVRLVFKQETAYPKLLAQLPDSPPVLFTIGNISVFDKKAIAVVGTRNASLNGKALARKIAFDLVEKGYQIVSGLAHGIDRAAHVGALASDKKPVTTAVLGSSVDEIYPVENEDIYQEIKENGCLISEFPFGTVLTPRNFPRRNRIISGLALGTLVIEAQERSGSLITAHEAASQGREVFAVPGSPVDPRSSGPNKLIRDGATLVSGAEDIIECIENLGTFRLADFQKETVYRQILPDEEMLTDARQIVWNNLGTDPISVDSLIRETGLEARLVNIILVELSLAGRLEHHPGNRVSMIYRME